MDYRAYIAERLSAEGVTKEEFKEAIVVPPDTSLGDYALPCFKFARTLRKPPAKIAEELAARFGADGVIESVAPVSSS